MNKKLPAALCILLTIPIMVSATTYISIDIQDNKSVNNEKKDYPTPDRNKIIAFPGADVPESIQQEVPEVLYI